MKYVKIVNTAIKIDAISCRLKYITQAVKVEDQRIVNFLLFVVMIFALSLKIKKEEERRFDVELGEAF